MIGKQTINRAKMMTLFDNLDETPYILCGIDEAGRGPIAGPLVLAGVILPKPIDGLADSKKLSAKKREELYLQIVSTAIYHIVVIPNSYIDEYGLSKSLHLGLVDIVYKLGGSGIKFLYDGNTNYGVDGISTLIKADTKVAQVSAASILAKVTRDNIMKHYSKVYPNYNFASHKGYPTKKHKELLQIYGPSPIHRVSFSTVAKRLTTPSLFEEI